MAVMQNSIIFGGIDSADFGIYIGGEGTFNAPKRDVEMISIPGRNGALALDKGRFENIEVTYSAFNYESDLATFAQNLSDFRNAICSQKGYQRLTDTFHTDEYRMAAYIDGLDIKPINYNTASTFEIKFDCQPQRFLMSGEAPITVSSGDTILNPTHFESKPMLEVEGYGTIGFNGYEIEIEDTTYGELQVLAPTPSQVGITSGRWSRAFTVLAETAHTGDAVKGSSFATISNFPVEVASINAVKTGTGFDASYSADAYTKQVRANMTNIEFAFGTAETKEYTLTVTLSGGTQKIAKMGVSYDGGENFSIYYTVESANACYLTESGFVLDSTRSIIEGDLYIDCDLGEAYKYEGGEVVSLNKYIDLGSELPTLAVGSNEITYDNTITDLKVTPRWWIV